MGSKRIGTFKKFLSQQRMKKINEANVNIECDWWDACIVEVIQEIDKECSGFFVWETIIKYCKDKWSILGRTLPQPEYDDNILTQHIKDLIFQFHGDSFYTDWKCDLGWDNQQVHSKGLVIEELAAVILEKVKEKAKPQGEPESGNTTGTLSDREEIKMVPMKPASSYDDEYCEDLPYAEVAKDSDLVITALPHGVSAKIVPELLASGAKVIDHSGDFRYKDLATYEKSYSLTHPNPELGCYPTCSLVALAPFLKNHLIEEDSIIIDATSGVSGAGRKSDLAYAFCELDESFKPYGAVGHRHTTEIAEQCSFLAGKNSGDIKVTFTPHLAPFKRGMLASVYAKPSAAFTDVSSEKINAIYKDFYKDEQFVRVLSGKTLPDIKAVACSNYIDVNGVYDPETNMIKLFTAQDNLGKGAALQAIQSANVMFGFEETAGLKNIVRGI